MSTQILAFRVLNAYFSLVNSFISKKLKHSLSLCISSCIKNIKINIHLVLIIASFDVGI